ncbi:MAG: helix-turn-helix transcriptional regulator [Actinobacteria bacterium]|nr:helix-turn-helix transcriptional regulator [Actinomycetota bacterium]
MPRTPKDFQKESKRANSEPVRRARAVFDQSYTIARQVLELREKHGLTQVELAQASGVPQSQISRIERAAISPTAATLSKIAAVLDADLRLVERRSA